VPAGPPRSGLLSGLGCLPDPHDRGWGCGLQGEGPPDPRDRGCCLGGGACWTPRSGLGLRVAVGGPPDPRDRGLGLGFASCGGTAPGAPCAADAAC